MKPTRRHIQANDRNGVAIAAFAHFERELMPFVSSLSRKPSQPRNLNYRTSVFCHPCTVPSRRKTARAQEVSSILNRTRDSCLFLRRFRLQAETSVAVELHRRSYIFPFDCLKQGGLHEHF